MHHYRKCIRQRKRYCNSFWISRLLVWIAVIGGNSLVTGAPANLDSHAGGVATKSAKYTELPDYILDLNDPHISGPVEYVFVLDDGGTKVLTWDLLPPLIETNPINEGHYHHPGTEATVTTLSSDHGVSPHPHPHQMTTGTNIAVNSHSTNTKTTTMQTTTEQTAINGRSTRSPLTGTATTTPTESYKDELLELPGGNSKTLPSWLTGIDDPELDVAVPYEVPEDLHSYTPTVEHDLLPPLAPYTDLHEAPFSTTNNTTKNTKQSHITTTTTTKAFASHLKTTKPTSKTSTTTTRRPSSISSSYKSHWSQTEPYKRTTTPTTTTTITLPKPTTTTTTTTTTLKSSHNSRHTTATSNSELRGAGSTHITTKSINNYTPRSTTTTPSTTTATTSTSYLKHTTATTITNRHLFTMPTGIVTKSPATTVRHGTTNHHNQQQFTTSTTVAPDLHGNPFEPTIPPWLKDFDYPDVGPGVPYVYDPSDNDDNSDHTALASETKTYKVAPPGVPSPIPSKSIATPLQIITDNEANTKKALSSFNPHIAAPIPTLHQPLDDHYESFPPYFNLTTSYDVPLIPTKTAYSKSNDEKFLRNNQLTNGAASKVTSTQSDASYNKGNAFANSASRFGGPPGVLAPPGSGALTVGFANKSPTPAAVAGQPYVNMHKILRIFGAPPGILTPYDNNKSKLKP